MNLQQFEYIIAVDRLKNFTRAAEQCFVTQATLSAMVKKLEEELDVIIFDRKGSPVITTEVGKEIIREAEILMRNASRIKDLASESKGLIRGTLKLGIIPTIASSLLPLVIYKLLESFPEMKLEIQELVSDEIVLQIKSGRLDAGIIATPWKDESIEEDILYYEALMVYGIDEIERKYILPNELIGEKIWLLEEGHCLRDQFINYCSLKKKISIPANLKFEANSFETLLNMVDQMGGLTLIPELYYRLLAHERKMKVRQFQEPLPVREISLIYHRPYAKINLIQAVGKLVKEEINPVLISNSFAKKNLQIIEIM
jgi:LysR family transcriptional regulator, hydrogen peroxide-inducible genes activator